jgi:uncharacterized protein YxjI
VNDEHLEENFPIEGSRLSLEGFIKQLTPLRCIDRTPTLLSIYNYEYRVREGKSIIRYIFKSFLIKLTAYHLQMSSVGPRR